MWHVWHAPVGQCDVGRAVVDNLTESTSAVPVEASTVTRRVTDRVMGSWR